MLHYQLETPVLWILISVTRFGTYILFTVLPLLAPCFKWLRAYLSRGFLGHNSPAEATRTPPKRKSDPHLVQEGVDQVKNAS